VSGKESIRVRGAIPLEELRRAAASAHAPYSGFRVGAIIEDNDGRLHSGCNVECASLGLSLCAERSALGIAIAAGATGFRRVWIYTPTPAPTPPCGACREALLRVAPELEVMLVCDGSAVTRTSITRLLPRHDSRPEDR
jgi:cytidine deaminase